VEGERVSEEEMMRSARAGKGDFCHECMRGGKIEFAGIAKHYHEPTEVYMCDGCYEVAINENLGILQRDTDVPLSEKTVTKQDDGSVKNALEM
jgi:hypothetical protein